MGFNSAFKGLNKSDFWSNLFNVLNVSFFYTEGTLQEHYKNIGGVQQSCLLRLSVCNSSFGIYNFRVINTKGAGRKRQCLDRDFGWERPKKITNRLTNVDNDLIEIRTRSGVYSVTSKFARVLQQLTGFRKINGCYSGKCKHVDTLHSHYDINSHFCNTVNPV